MGSFLLRSLGALAHQPACFAGLVLSLVVQGTYQIGSPLLYKLIFDEGIAERRADILVQALLGLGLLLLLHAAATFGQEFFITRAGVRQMNRLRRRLFERMQDLPPRLVAERSPAEWTTLLGADVNAIETATVRALPPFLLQAGVILVSILLLFVIEWRLASITLAALPVIFLLPQAFGRRAKQSGGAYASAASKMVALAQETSITHPVVWLFGLRRARLDAFQARLATMERAGAEAHMFAGLIGRTAFIGTGLSQLVVIGAGALLAVNGYMTAGYLVAFVGLLLRISDGVGQIANAIPLVVPAAAAQGRIEAFLATETTPLEDPGAAPLGRLSGAVRFEGVRFGYQPDKPALSDLSLEIEPGERVALVGPSGSGKSTVMALLLRLLRAQEGRILLDGRPIESIAEDSLRANMSVVPQNPILFDASVRDNILVGRPEASEEEVVAAAKAAGIHEAILAKPEGYDAWVGAAGGQFSGGERQRIALARALVRNAPFLLLDEATSALDPATEHWVNKSIGGLAGRRTIVSVTHRLSSVVEFDRIFVFDKGRLVESGDHASLLARNGLYRSLWTKQQGFALDAEAGEAPVTPERLALIPFLSRCSPATLAELAALFLIERFADGSYVFRQGDPGDKFYIVAHGRVEVRLAAGEEERIVAVLEDGDFFGELALVRNQPRAAGIRARTDSLCLALPRQHFLKLMQTEELVRRNIAEAIAAIQRQNGRPRAGEG